MSKLYMSHSHVNSLICECASCHNINYIDVDLDIRADADITHQLIVSMTCNKCGVTNFFGANTTNVYEQKVVQVLRDKGYNFTNELGIDTMGIRHFTADFSEEIVKQMKYYIPDTWQFEINERTGTYQLYPYSKSFDPSSSMYQELLDWINNDLPDAEF